MSSVLADGNITDDILDNIDELIDTYLDVEDPTDPDAGSAVGSSAARSPHGKNEIEFQRLLLKKCYVETERHKHEETEAEEAARAKAMAERQKIADDFLAFFSIPMDRRLANCRQQGRPRQLSQRGPEASPETFGDIFGRASGEYVDKNGSSHQAGDT